VPESKGYTYGDDVLGLIQLMLDKIELLPGKLELALVPKAVNALFKIAYDRPERAIGTIGETFRNTVFRGKLFSAAYALDRADVPRVVNEVLAINRQIPFAGVIAMRFVKGTQATLGFTRFPDTCVLELDGVDADINHGFADALTAQLELLNIPYTLHWGKVNDVLNPQRVRTMYGNARVDTWLRHRRQLLSAEAREVFCNGFMERCGLHQKEEVIV
jgi:hypothetical protein